MRIGLIKNKRIIHIKTRNRWEPNCSLLQRKCRIQIPKPRKPKCFEKKVTYFRNYVVSAFTIRILFSSKRKSIFFSTRLYSLFAGLQGKPKVLQKSASVLSQLDQYWYFSSCRHKFGSLDSEKTTGSVSAFNNPKCWGECFRLTSNRANVFCILSS